MAGGGPLMWMAGGLVGLVSLIPSLDMAGAQAASPGAAVSVPRAPDGQYYADVSIGGRHVRALIDPQASAVLIAGSDAAALGLGDSAGVRMLPPLAIGSLTLSGVEGQVAPGLPVTIIGRPALDRLSRVSVDDGALLLN